MANISKEEREKIEAALTEKGIAFEKEASSKDLKNLLESSITPPPTPPIQSSDPKIENGPNPETKTETIDLNGKRVYSQDDVMKLMTQLKQDFEKRLDAKENPVLMEKETEHFAKVHRIRNKFVVGFVNQNNDPYAPNKVIHAYEVWDDREKMYLSFIEVIYEDGTTEKMPLKYYVENRNSVPCAMVKTRSEDRSYLVKSNDSPEGQKGLIEVKETQGYDYRGTGAFVPQKVAVKENFITVIMPNGSEKEFPEYALA